MWDVTGSVSSGRLGGEASWVINDFIEMRVSGQPDSRNVCLVNLSIFFFFKYVVKLIVKSLDGLPEYIHEELVQLVTDEARDFESDEAREYPAVGLINHATGGDSSRRHEVRVG